MRRNQNGNQQGHPYLQAGLAAGYFCRRTEEELERIGAASGGAVSGRELGEWMGKFLLSKSQAHADGVDYRQRVSQVRARSAAGYALGAGEAETHVRPRHKRSLSAAASKAISDAQKKRWKLAKQAERARKSAKPGNWLHLSSAEKQRWYRANPGSGKTGHPKGAVHWTQTPKGREYMKKTAAARFGRKVVSKPRLDRSRIMPRGFWQAEIAKLLARGPVRRHEVHEALARRFPEKRQNLFVTFATMKAHGELVETNGMFSLPQSNGTAEVAAS